MGVPVAKCSFCDAVASFGPYEAAHACDACARRVARLAESSGGEARSTIWSTAGAPAAIAKNAEQMRGDEPDADEVFAQFKLGVEKRLSADDADSHLNLAIAYREMALYGDAVREAAVAFRATRDRKKADEAMGILLSPPLLKPDGIEALRARFTMN
jgi:hypothetical protein